VQNELAAAQTRLTLQAAKIEDISYLVKNLFENMVYESVSCSDTNKIAYLQKKDGHIQLWIKLQYAPIPQSIEMSVHTEGSLTPHSTMVGPFTTFKNVLPWNLYNYDMQKTSISFKYVKDVRETNLVKTVTIQDTNTFSIDGQRVPLN
jgi:hypothetical protein